MVTRISGLASGMDTESIVSDMMKVARLPLDKLTKKQQTLEWKRDDYRAMNTALLTFRNELSNMKYTKNYRVRSVESTDATKVTATATNVAIVGSTTISKVEQLATSASVVSKENGLAGKSSNSTLQELNITATKISINNNGKTTELTFKESDTIDSIISKINDSDAGITMYFDSFKGQMSLVSKQSGAGAITVAEDLASAFGFDGVTGTPGQNAKLTINGIVTERSSNTFTENGVTHTLKQTFDDSVTTTITNDTDAVYNNIKSFIDKYNELIASVQSKIGEERNKDYDPLTDEEKESLSEKQIEKWENIAKTGLLRNDTTLSSALSNMRLNFSSSVSNKEISSIYNNLSKIGITTTSNYLDGGKLEINEEKLKAAIAADPDSVEQLFRGENGIVGKLYDTVTNTMDNIKLKAGNANSTNQTFTIGRELDSVDDRISDLEDRLKQIEARYWKQFTAMETAIQKANDQYSTLSSYFSTGS
ncbi:MAG: flagellar hook-associated protein 2 [Bacillus sp. (in: firmicutes)]